MEVLGHGGTAVVYLAEHTALGKQVALKQLLPRWSAYPGLRQRFLQEARIACALDHDALPRVHDFVSDEDLVYFVMDVIRGETLQARIDSGRLLMGDALHIAAQIADAVAAVHAAGVLHLDIKTENVMLHRRGDRELPVLIDFGIAQVTQPATFRVVDTAGVLPAGTPRCMAPEQAAGERLDQRADVWALGVMLYELLAPGTSPFEADSVRDTLVKIVSADPPPLSPAIPAPLSALVMECLDKDPDRRPASAAHARDRIRQAAHDYDATATTIDRALQELELDDVLASLDAEQQVAYRRAA